MSTFVAKGCYIVSMTDPYGRILGVLDCNLYIGYLIAMSVTRLFSDDDKMTNKCGVWWNETWQEKPMFQGNMLQI
jgi:hypothetical protein